WQGCALPTELFPQGVLSEDRAFVVKRGAKVQSFPETPNIPPLFSHLRSIFEGFASRLFQNFGRVDFSEMHFLKWRREHGGLCD
ncbi:MAG: hypothetical protein SOR67_08655, partial [Alloprevotella sp.]|nr:hypothetical protein [Alloprevotella sp.]